MKRLAFITGFILLFSIASYADEKNDTHSINTTITNTFIINNSHLSPLLELHDFTQSTDNDALIFKSNAQIQGKYTAGRMSIETGLMQSQQTSNWSKYYFSGAITLHQNSAFNLSLTASIEQLKSIDLKHYQTPVLASLSINNEAKLNYSYGLVGSYSVNSTWHFSGGITHSPTINDTNNAVLYSNTHMALVGATYSF